MSHVATCDLHITDLDAMRQACEALGLEFMEGQKTWRWFGRWVKDYHGEDAAYKNGISPKDYGHGVHAIRVKGDSTGYEIGLVARPDGKPGFQAVWDFFGSGRELTNRIGEGAQLLKDNYGAVVGAKQLRKEGWQVKTTTKAGEIVVTARKL